LPANVTLTRSLPAKSGLPKTGAMSVSCLEQVETMLGQGSVGLEIEQQAPKLDTLLVAVVAED